MLCFAVIRDATDNAALAAAQYVLIVRIGRASKEDSAVLVDELADEAVQASSTLICMGCYGNE
jgi:hypothetical protein